MSTLFSFGYLILGPCNIFVMPKANTSIPDLQGVLLCVGVRVIEEFKSERSDKQMSCDVTYIYLSRVSVCAVMSSSGLCVLPHGWHSWLCLWVFSFLKGFPILKVLLPPDFLMDTPCVFFHEETVNGLLQHQVYLTAIRWYHNQIFQILQKRFSILFYFCFIIKTIKPHVHLVL